MRILHYSLLLLLLLHTPLSITAATDDHTILKPFDYITGELVELDTGVKRYLLTALKPSTGYEVRVSFPASIPAAIKFQIVDGSGAAATAIVRQPARHLLDCEKLIVSTDSQGAVQSLTGLCTCKLLDFTTLAGKCGLVLGGDESMLSASGAQGFTEPVVLLTAKRRSVHRDGPTAGAKKLVYNIVLAELVPVVGLPLDSIPTVVAVVLVVLVSLVWSLYWSNRIYPRLIVWLTAPTAARDRAAAATAASTGPAAAHSKRLS